MLSDFSRQNGLHNIRGLAFILIFLLIFNFVFYFLGIYTAGIFYHLGYNQVRDLLVRPDGSAIAINLARYISVIDLVGYMFIPVLLYTIISNSSIAKEGNLNHKIGVKPLYISVLIAALSIPLVDYFTEWMHKIPLPQKFEYYAQRFENSRELTLNTILDMHALPELFVCLALVALVPAFFEELMFRGAILNIFKNMTPGKWLPIILQAVIFGALHFSFYQFPAILFMGIIFGYIAYKTGTIWYGAIMHFLFNGTAVVLQYLNHTHFDKTGVNGKFQNIHLSHFTAITAICGVFLLLSLYNKDLNVSLQNGKE